MRVSAFGCSHPMTSSERRIMAHVLQMAAFEVRDPIQAFV